MQFIRKSYCAVSKVDRWKMCYSDERKIWANNSYIESTKSTQKEYVISCFITSQQTPKFARANAYHLAASHRFCVKFAMHELHKNEIWHACTKYCVELFHSFSNFFSVASSLILAVKQGERLQNANYCEVKTNGVFCCVQRRISNQRINDKLVVGWKVRFGRMKHAAHREPKDAKTKTKWSRREKEEERNQN